MQTIRSINEMQSQAVGLRAKGHMIGLVATMGSLHQGHIDLIRRAKQVADTVIVSIFVNPTQFGPNEDFKSYPRTLEDDCRICEDEGADIVFAPNNDEIYPSHYSTYVNEEVLSQSLCGKSRPNHFRGVCTVVAKLFNICRPDIAIFGQKDAQQVAIIKRMTEDLNFNIDIETVETARDEDGLACSSRNKNLSEAQRKEALNIYGALSAGKALIDQGVTQAERIESEVIHFIKNNRRVRIIYVEIMDRETFKTVTTVEAGKCLIAVAAWVDEVRLIDNILI